MDNLFHKDKVFLGECNNNVNSEYVDNLMPNRFEKELLKRSQSMNSGRLRENWFSISSNDVTNSQRNHVKINGNGKVNGVVGIMRKTVLDEEFPLLGADDHKHSNSEFERVLSSSSHTSNHSLMTDALAATVSNGLTSASHEIPVTVGNNGVAVMMHQHNDSASTSVAPRAMNLNMAETLVHGPPRSHTPPQLSVSTQKLEELALKQSRLLIPMTPSTPRSLAASSFDKLKVKTRQLEYPFSHSHSPSHSQHGAHPSPQIQKTTSGNSYDISASRELNGVSLAAKDNLSPNGSRVVLSNATTSAWITLEKRPTFQTQSRSDFLKNLSKKSSSKDSSCSLENSEASTRNDTNCLTQKSRDAPPVDISVVNSLTEHSSNITAQNGNVLGEPLKYSGNEEQQYITKPIFHSEDEEIAFLRSLGWEEGSEDDEGLTDEEIRDFYEKYGKLQQ